MMPLRREPAQQRLAAREIEDRRRIDQRRDENDRRAAAAIIAQTGAQPFVPDPREAASWPAIGGLIARQSGKRGCATFGRCCGLAAQHLKEKRQWAGPVLRRGMKGCYGLFIHARELR